MNHEIHFSRLWVCAVRSSQSGILLTFVRRGTRGCMEFHKLVVKTSVSASCMTALFCGTSRSSRCCKGRCRGMDGWSRYHTMQVLVDCMPPLKGVSCQQSQEFHVISSCFLASVAS